MERQCYITKALTHQSTIADGGQILEVEWKDAHCSITLGASLQSYITILHHLLLSTYFIHIELHLYVDIEYGLQIQRNTWFEIKEIHAKQACNHKS